MFIGSEHLSKQVDIKYTNITLNVGVAVKEFHVQWNQPEKWLKVIINLWNIHAVQDFLVQLDDIYLRAHCRKFCTSKECFSRCYEDGFVWKALQSIVRYYIKHKTCTTDVPKELLVACVTHYEEFGKIRSLEFVKKCLIDYQSVKDNAKNCVICFFIRNSIFHLNLRLLKKRC